MNEERNRVSLHLWHETEQNRPYDYDTSEKEVSLKNSQNH